MPISEDEFDSRSSVQESNVTMSKAELRKTHKPIMEKRRRARINHCLNEIKSLILEAMNKDPSRHSKLEKADILEMAVKHLQNTQRQQLAIAMATDPNVLRKFKTGFNDCASEIDKYISQIDSMEPGLKQRVSNHLQKCIGGIEQVAHFNFPGLNNFGFLGQGGFSTTSTNETGDQNNNPSSGASIQVPQGIHLIPSRLPSGELALLVPNSSNIPLLSSLANASNQPSQRSSAFATVIPSSINKPLSPPLSPQCDDGSQHSECMSSPHGFRPVLQKRFLSVIPEEQQVQHVTSSGIDSKSSSEVKSIKFPIHNYQSMHVAEKRYAQSPKKSAEPLCIITNQGERYKVAQTKEDSAYYEENSAQRGLKRKFNEGLLTVSQQQDYPPKKVIKIQPTVPQVIRPIDFSKMSYQREEKSNWANPGGPSTSRDNADNQQHDAQSDSMWRPW